MCAVIISGKCEYLPEVLSLKLLFLYTTDELQCEKVYRIRDVQLRFHFCPVSTYERELQTSQKTPTNES